MQPVIERRWRIRESDEALVSTLSREKGIDPLVARVLACRGIGTIGAAGRFLSPSLADLPDPFLLDGMEQAVARLVAARDRNETVIVHGDYDVDGITSTAMLVQFLSSVGIRPGYHIPLRLEHGYGLSADGIRAIADQGATVCITVDCGISSIEEARLCRSLGIDLIITDHHTPGEVLPEACAVINPLLSPSYPCSFLAGVGVAFNLMIALRKGLRDAGVFVSMSEPDLRSYLDFVALGTIADVVPLLDVNRVFVQAGLKLLGNSTRPGVLALRKVAGVEGAVSAGSVGFRLAPRLNAAGRLEDAAQGVELLLSQDRHEAERLAAMLDASNAERQELERQILQEAVAQLKSMPTGGARRTIVLASSDWHPGVIGIVASRMVELYHRPTILISLQDGSGRGSGRSIPGFHLYQALHACEDMLVKFGGHRQAAGLSIDEATLVSFADRFDDVAAGLLSEEDLVPEIVLDGEIDPSDLTMGLADMLERLAPFGMGNPEPHFVLRGVTVVAKRILKEVHVKLVLDAGGKRVEAIGFNMADRPIPDMADLAVSLQINEWNGRRNMQLRIKDLRPATSSVRGGGDGA